MIIDRYHTNIIYQVAERIYPFSSLSILVGFAVSGPRKIWILLWFMQTIHLHTAKLMWIYSICYSWWSINLRFLCLYYCDCSFYVTIIHNHLYIKVLFSFFLLRINHECQPLLHQIKDSNDVAGFYPHYSFLDSKLLLVAFHIYLEYRNIAKIFSDFIKPFLILQKNNHTIMNTLVISNIKRSSLNPSWWNW